MESVIKLIVLVFALAAIPGLVPAAEPSPSEKSAPPVRAYVSAFDGYRPLIDEPMRPWRDVNDEVGRLGGHIGHIGSDAGTPDRPGTGSAGTVPRPVSGNTDTGTAGAHSGHHR